MPITRVIDRLRRRLTVHSEGHVTFEDIRGHMENRAEEGLIGYDQIFDARDAVLDLTGDQMRTLAWSTTRVVAGGVPYGCMAFVTNDATSFGMARMFGMLTEDSGLPVQVFYDIDEAERWLDARGRQGPKYSSP